ncbi:hypothetical protein [Dyadobacter bucti]|uniref:hypothetical protein n=1 Tax=Dyadobacter bucti TaxID=2572203 RepID=UPI0011094FDC|nr:hypothetical protein [Dyadobacter bucti]
MKISDAKNIPIDDFLESLGHACTKEVGGRKWYKRPYGNENTASFVLSVDKNAWYDHGEGVGGNILDLAIKYANIAGISEALKFIENTVGSGYIIPTIRQELKAMEPELPYYDLIGATDFNIYSGGALSRNAQYLNSRGIDPKAAAPYLKDIRFVARASSKKSYSGLGMQNNSGGFEVRRAGDWAKTSVGSKDVSAFFADRDHAPWLAFYSMIDFCSFITIDQPPIGTYNYLVINGDGLVGKAQEFIRNIPVGTMIHYPHRDISGQKAFHKLLDYMTTLGWSGADRAHLYEGFKDLAEAQEKKLRIYKK